LYKALAKEGYDHQPIEFNVKDNPAYLKWLLTMISNTKAFIGGTFHGLAPKHLQAYLNENFVSVPTVGSLKANCLIAF
jgi:hypothetical protein